MHVFLCCTGSSGGFYDDDDDDIVTGTVRPAHLLGAHTVGSTASTDDRPITPMRNTMIYNKEHSSLDFKDGLYMPTPQT